MLLAAFLPVVATAAGDAPAVAEDEPTQEEKRRAAMVKVKAAYLQNFLRYVKWPQSAFRSAEAESVICVLGDGPLGEYLDRKSKEWEIKKRRVKVLRLVDAVEVKTGGCHIVYIGNAERSRQKLILGLLHGQPVLTVSEARNLSDRKFRDVDGSIKLRLRLRDIDFVKDRVDSEFDVNLDATRLAGLTINSKMLELAKKILQNGVERSKD